MGIPTLISTSTASNAANISITSGIDSTYDEYMFVFTDITPATNETSFGFQVNATDGADYNDSAITSAFMMAYHQEDDGAAAMGEQTSYDQAQGTAYQPLCISIADDADAGASGILHLFGPASTTYIKHFHSRFQVAESSRADDAFVTGIINDTTAIDDISFKMASGNFDGVIQMYGIA